MDSMFDRLGDLLSDTLDGNPIFENDFLQGESVEHQIESESKLDNGKINVLKNKEQSHKKTVAKNLKPNDFFVPYHLKSEFSLLGITNFKTSEDEIKNAFKEKIKFFHPDKQKDIPVLQKIATERTAKIVEAYKKIQEWLSSRAVL